MHGVIAELFSQLPKQMCAAPKSTDSFEIIESYPEDKYLSSYLLYAVTDGNQVFHVLFAVDVEQSNVRVVTVYYPDAMQWRNHLKTRRSR